MKNKTKKEKKQDLLAVLAIVVLFIQTWYIAFNV